MKAIILAAGRGNRLKTVSEETPKCMIEVGDKSLMHHQLAALKNNGITDIVIGVGYRKDDVAAHAQKIDGMQFTFVDNPDYATTNTAYTLWMCREEMDDDFLYLNADVLFHESLISRVLDASEANVLALDNKRCGAEEVKAILKDDTILHIGKKLDQGKCYGEFIGIGKFDSKINDQFIARLDETVNEKMLVNEYFEYALDMLVKEEPFHYVDISDIPCIEIDFPEDLKHAEEVVYPEILEF